MDDLKLILFLLVLVIDLAACAKPGSDVCKNYISPFEVKFGDGSVRKAQVESCGNTLYASSLDQSNETIAGDELTIRLKDNSGNDYFTELTP